MTIPSIVRMIKLLADSQAKEFLYSLAQEANNPGIVQVMIESMPAFLNTPIAVRIFEYQIASYPKSIIWHSDNPGILEYLIKQGFATHRSSQLSLPDSSPKANSSLPRTLSLRSSSFERSSLLEKVDYSQTVESKQFGPNFDSIIERLQKARNNLKGTAKKTGFKPNVIAKTGVLVAVISSSILMLSLFTAFPTQVYTLEITPITNQQNSELALGLSRFSRASVDLVANSIIPTTGQRLIPTTKPNGKIRISNQGDQPVSLKSSNLRFDFGSNIYSSPDGLNPVSFDLEAGGRNTIELTIESQREGPQFNLAKDVNLDMTDALGANICPTCTISTTTIINASNSLNFGFVSQSDLDNLRDQNNQKINYQIVTKINQLSLDGNINSFNWFKIASMKEVYDKDLNQQSAEASLVTTTIVDFLFVPEDELTKLIKEDNAELVEINNLKLTKITGSFQSLDPSEVMQLSLSYDGSYYESLSVSDMNYNSFSEDQIQIKYPNVQRIQKREMGIPIPGITPRIKIDLVKK